MTAPESTLPGDFERKRGELERKIRAREFVFGIQDGLISTVGLLTGIAVATQDRRVVLITGLAAAVTGGVSMATGSYLASKTEKEIFEKELLDQERLASDTPWLAQEALLESLVGEGLDRPSAYRVVKLFSRRQELLLRTVQEKVLGLGTADISNPIQAAGVMFVSFLVGAALPTVPFVVAAPRVALPISWTLSIATLLLVGVFKGILTRRPRIRSGLEFASVALGSAAAGWILGWAIEAFAG